MKIYIPDYLQDKIIDSNNRICILGTINIDDGVTSVTDVILETDALQQRDDFETHNEAQPFWDRKLLTILDPDNQKSNGIFQIDPVERSKWFYRDTLIEDVIVYDTKEYFKRNPFDSTVLKSLERERILVVGLGSVGAKMGLELAKSGVGTFISVDKDIMKVHNAMRHPLGLPYMGWSKAKAFKQYLKEQAPNSDCIDICGDIFNGNNPEMLKYVFESLKPSRILALTDSLQVQYQCQELAIDYNLPFMAVACDSHAVEGEIFIWEPGQANQWKPGRPKRGCYGCLRDPNKTQLRSEHFEYGIDDPESSGPIPALGLYIERVTNIASIFTLAWILRDCETETELGKLLNSYYEGKGLQYIRLGGPYSYDDDQKFQAENPWGVEWYRVSKNEDCVICGSDRVPRY